MDYDVCSNYGNWLYSAGIGNDPRDNRKFNMIKQGLDYDGNVSLVWLLYKDECSEGHVVFSGSRGDQWAVWIRNQFLCLLTRSWAGSPLCTGQCNFNNLLLSPGRLELPTPSLVSGLSVSSPFLQSHSHIPSVSHTDASLSMEQLLGELRSYLRNRTFLERF